MLIAYMIALFLIINTITLTALISYHLVMHY
jgi:hypothetical protein